jgi:hypothetical protein
MERVNEALNQAMKIEAAKTGARPPARCGSKGWSPMRI